MPVFRVAGGGKRNMIPQPDPRPSHPIALASSKIHGVDNNRKLQQDGADSFQNMAYDSGCFHADLLSDTSPFRIRSLISGWLP